MADVGTEAPVEELAPPASLDEAKLRLQGEVAELDLRRNETGAERGRKALRYLTYPKLLEQVRPLLQKNQLTWSTFPTTMLEGEKLKSALRYELKFVPTGEVEGDTMLTATKEDTSQAQGSGITYGRRYALQAVLDIAPDGDDDGEAASTAAPRPAPADPEAPLNEESLNAMREAVAEAGWELPKVLEHVGASDPVTVGDARKVKALLDERKAAA